MFRKLPQVRRFHYLPRFFKPDEDEEPNKRIKFRRLTNRAPLQRRPFWWLLLMIAIVLMLIYYLFGRFNTDRDNMLLEDVKIDVVD